MCNAIKRMKVLNNLQKTLDTLDKLELLIEKLNTGEIKASELVPLDSNLSLNQAMQKDLQLVSKGRKS